MAETLIRRPKPGDADALSALILRALEANNLPDYGRANIDRVAAHFTPAYLRGYMQDWTMFVAERAGVCVGTGSYFDATARAVFVDPSAQGHGVGRALMDAICEVSRQAGDPALTLRASLYAVPFYTRLGFVAEGDLWRGDERTVAMRSTPERHLASRQRQV